MKAYNVTDNNGDLGTSYIIFAETRGKAISYAKSHCDDAFDDYDWTYIRALRSPALDGYYRGCPEMDWNDPDDRVAMVREANFECSFEVDVTPEECAECPAHEWCDRYERMGR